VEEPRFAQHLPEGAFLDWSFQRETRSGSHTRFRNVPSHETVVATWGLLADHLAAHIAGNTTDPETIDFVAGHARSDESLRAALVKNPATPLSVVIELLDIEPRLGNLEFLLRERRPEDLGALIVEGFAIGGHARNRVAWLAAFVTGNALTDSIDLAFSALDDSYHPLLVEELARNTSDGVPVGRLLHYAINTPQPMSDSFWRAMGHHLAGRGTDSEIRTAVANTTSTALRLSLLGADRISLATAVNRLSGGLRRDLIERHSEIRPLSLDETLLVSSLGLPAEALHDFHYDSEAVDWAIDSGDAQLGGAVAWKSPSDAVLVRVLRRNPESHRWAKHHLWRIGRIWHRLTQGTRRSIAGHFDPAALSTLNVASVRQWLVANGEPAQVGALNLPRVELRSLVDRVERERDPAVAWIAAHLVERPRERVRMAEIGLAADDREAQLQRWVRSASSHEVVRLWNVAEGDARDDLAKALVRGLRASDDTHWLDKLVGGLRIDWQGAPMPVQEAAAVYLASNGGDEETWTVIWSLYPEWNGTLDELIETARSL
jgi:hypothetical protein